MGREYIYNPYYSWRQGFKSVKTILLIGEKCSSIGSIVPKIISQYGYYY
jgi:hypothetical protein